MTESYFTRLNQCLISDSVRLNNKLLHLNKSATKHDWELFEAELKIAEDKYIYRARNFPTCNFNEDLPILRHKLNIQELVAEHQVVIITGETGSGKTSQLPKICLELGIGSRGFIGHTQPRRIAARSVALRISEELKVELGREVGYKIRFKDMTCEHSYLKVMTDGILLAEACSCPNLLNYEAIIVDEAHERSLNIDFILGYLKKLLKCRPDLKVIITSATLEVSKFAKFFNNAPIIAVEGKTYPITTLYRELKKDITQVEAIALAIQEVWNFQLGNILVFFATEYEIRETNDFLRKNLNKDIEILVLFSRLSTQEQQKIFTSSAKVRIILTTNIAETSLTVPNIKYVIDTGKARIRRYNYRTCVERLPIEPVSQASANQRKGRCGRVQAGICIRLYSEEDFLRRPLYTEPEILRASLAAVVLQMKILKLGDIDKFPFLQSPDIRFIKEAIRLLLQLEAIEENGELTIKGKAMGRLPVNPQNGAQLIAAAKLGAAHEVAVIIAGLNGADPRGSPMSNKDEVLEYRKRFEDKESDLLSLLNLWEHLSEQSSSLTNSQFKLFCKKYYLSIASIYEWRNNYSEIKKKLLNMHYRWNEQPSSPHIIYQALLSGWYTNVGLQEEKNCYRGIKQKIFHISSQSVLYNKPPKWIMCASIIETHRLNGHMVTKIQPEWLERTAYKLLKKQYSEPWWDQTKGHVYAFENASIFGLPLYSKRYIAYEKINKLVAREIFIKEALVEGKSNLQENFFDRNRQFLEEFEYWEKKERRHRFVINKEQLVRFFSERLPLSVYSQASFKKFLKTYDKELLCYNYERLGLNTSTAPCISKYPDFHIQGDYKYILKYNFSPGHKYDGISIVIPYLQIANFDHIKVDWLIPGLLTEKITALLKSLPKEIRRDLVPIKEFVVAIENRLVFGKGVLKDEISRIIRQITGTDINNKDWQLDKIPAYLKINFIIIDEKDNIIIQDRDWKKIKKELLTGVKDKINECFLDINNDKRKVFQDWPDYVKSSQTSFIQNNNQQNVYVAIVANEQGVEVSYYLDPIEANWHHSHGVEKLFCLKMIPNIVKIKKNLVDFKRISLLYISLWNQSNLIDNLVKASIRETLIAEKLPYNKEDFIKLLAKQQSQLFININNVWKLLKPILKYTIEIKKTLSNSNRIPTNVREDIQQQLNNLLPNNFISIIRYSYLKRLPVYLTGIKIRLQKVEESGKTDSGILVELNNMWLRYTNLLQKIPSYKIFADLQDYRWLLEEYRLSIFAQTLKTSQAVSKKRLQIKWKKILELCGL